MASPRARLHLCAAFCLLPLVPLSLRLGQLQVLQHRRLTTLASGELQRETVELVPRGRILDRHGHTLAESLPAWSAFLDPSVLKAPDRAASALAGALGLQRRDVLRKARGPGRFVWLKRKLTLDEVSRLKALRIEGVGFVADERRFYPNGDLALGLLGAVGTEGKGLSGLELTFDKKLSGKAQRVALLRDGAGKTMTATPRRVPEPPPDLTLTLDRGIQHYAEEALKEAAIRHDPLWGAVLVQDPRTGDLLGMAAYPPDPLKNPILQNVYEPGSTFKAVTMAAVLDDGVARAEDSIDCSGPWELAPSVFIKDHEPNGVLSLRDLMAVSSNIGTAKLGLRLGADRFHRYARAFGFGARTALAFPGESAGILKAKGALDRVSLGNNAFGQGLGVTPLQLVGAYSALANGGTLLEPRLVLGLGNAPSAPREPVTVRRVASEEAVRAVGSMLEAVVESGTGMSAAVAGYTVAGKTGTSQKVDPATRRYSSSNYIASFAGWVPAREPRFSIVVILDSPKGQYYGAEVASPVFAKLARAVLALHAVPPDRTLPVRWASAAAAPRTAGPLRRAR